MEMNQDSSSSRDNTPSFASSMEKAERCLYHALDSLADALEYLPEDDTQTRKKILDAFVLFGLSGQALDDFIFPPEWRDQWPDADQVLQRLKTSVAAEDLNCVHVCNQLNIGLVYLNRYWRDSHLHNQ